MVLDVNWTQSSAKHYQYTCKVCLASYQRQYHRKDPVTRMLWNARQRAKEFGVPFDLTKEDIVIPERCPLLGVKLRVADGQVDDNSPTLDRIIPWLGYVRGNVVVVSWRANRIKNDASAAELRQIADWLDKHILSTGLLPASNHPPMHR